MMKRNVLIVAAVMLLFSFVAIIGCKPNKAIQYNDNLINHQQKVIAKMIDLSKTFVKKDRVSMSMKLTELEEEIDEAIAAVTKTPGYEGNTDLRDALLDLLEFYKEICGNEYRDMIEIIGSGSISQTDMSHLQEMEREITEREMELDEQLAKVQKEFARKHNIRIEKNKLQKEIDNM
jgi:uncharacterized membrane protein